MYFWLWSRSKYVINLANENPPDWLHGHMHACGFYFLFSFSLFIQKVDTEVYEK